MPFSNPVHRQAIREFLIKHWPKGKRVVDIGAGAGAYADLLRDYFFMVGVEVFKRYVTDYNLGAKYKSIIQADVMDLHSSAYRDSIVIMGDILEHLSVSDAHYAIKVIQQGADALLIAVPFLYEQGPNHPDTIKFGNPHEVHLQPDLTHDLFMERYPGFTEIARNEQIGVYYWSRG